MIRNNRVQKRFSAHDLGNFDDWRIKSNPKELKFCRHDHKGLVNMSTKGIDESFHGLGGMEEFRAKTGVFFRTPRTLIRVNSWFQGISIRLDVLESLQRVTRSSENHSSSRAQDSSKENRIHPKQSTNRTRLNWIQNPGGHKEDWASFPDQSQYNNSKLHASNP